MATYIPRPDANFNEWQQECLVLISSKVEQWHIPQVMVDALSAPKTVWETAYLIARNRKNCTPADIEAKNVARAAYEKLWRELFSGFVINNPFIPADDRLKLGLKPKDRERTPSPVPATAPIARIETARRQHIIHFVDELTPNNKARPAGVRGCEIWVKIGGEAPVLESELTFVALDTVTPYVLEFSGADGGKTAHYWLRWVNSRGQHGKWSRAVSATIDG